MSMTEKGPDRGRGPLARSPQDIAAGLFLVLVAAFAIWQSTELPMGTLRAMGPGMLPRALAVLVGVSGIVLVISSFFEDGEKLSRWHLRGPIFILGGVVVFALTIRTLGLAFAGPLAMIVGSFASDEVRWKETIIFAVAMTAFCILLFKVALGLPIPVVAFM